MKSIIKEMINGRRGQIDMIRVPDNERLTEEIQDTHVRLKEELNPELFTVFKKHVDALYINFSEEADFYFSEGFKLGLLLGIECMEDV